VKTNPIQTQSNPIAERVKFMQGVYLQRNMKKNAAKGYEKQSQNKPNLPESKIDAKYVLTKDYEEKCG